MKKTNNQILLEFLQNGGVVTTRIAPDVLGIADVRANIRDLRNMGYPVKDRKVSGFNRRGNKTFWKEYYMEMIDEPINTKTF